MATITSPRSDSPASHHRLPRLTSPPIPQSPSLGGTPTSSVRPSFDLPHRTGSASPGPTPLGGGNAHNNNGLAASNPQRRNRAALRDYYNLKSKPQPQSSNGAGTPGGTQTLTRSASIVSAASDSAGQPLPSPNDQISHTTLPSQLDSPSFSASDFVAELLTTASLRDILRTESALVSEIRNLDGERKALVYDNYSKLIAAVGTIAEMQKGMHTGVGDVAGKGGSTTGIGPGYQAKGLGLGLKSEQTKPGLEGVQVLKDKIDALVTVVTSLAPAAAQESNDQEASSHRDLRTRQNKIETVKWVLAAPERLSDLVANDRLEEAKSEYRQILDIVNEWDGVRGVDEVKAKCAKVMQESEKDATSQEKDAADQRSDPQD
ncbi:hypothetical protein B0A52_00612 [Exophiala mesophila]|uniref:Vacuolar protein sorting-associated protein 51 homolog n=1 Tax=Exophiala mesophila TaxID=212818 RepID=A0A438NHQ5_EXOME|nr:hypothetical protein B0A52_00612 [Exophiala mesophila]